MRQPNPERGLFMDIQKKQFMNIYGSLMDIYDEKKQTFKTKKNRHSRRKKHKHSRRQENQGFYTNPTFSPSNCPI